jgi:PAS domain S-box-containing protein
MAFSELLDKALEDRGNAVAVIGNPTAGEGAVLLKVNSLFARIFDHSTDDLLGLPFGALERLVKDRKDWSILIAALSDLRPLSLDMKLQLSGCEIWFGFGLTFSADGSSKGSFGIIIGRDITQARRQAMQESETQRLLASVFLRIPLAVAIVQADGTILMANPGLQQLLGYRQEELVGLSVEKLIPPEYREVARTARTKQFSDGEAYSLRMTTLLRSEARLPIILHVSLLRDQNDPRRLRIVAIIPDKALAEPEHVDASGAIRAAAQPPQHIGQLRAINMSALRTAFGDAWPRVSSQAMMMAERHIKQCLGPADAFCRAEDDQFIIWFDDEDEMRNASILTRLTRDIRIHFLTEFGDVVAGQIRSVMITAKVGEDPGKPSSQLLKQFQDKQRSDAADATALLEEIQAQPVADLRLVTGRDGRTQTMAFVDFAPSVRRRVARILAMSDDPDWTAQFDLWRLDLAMRGLARRSDRLAVLVPLAWSTVTSKDSRRELNELLGKANAVHRRSIRAAISGIPQQVSGKRWLGVTEPLRQELGSVDILLNAADCMAPNTWERVVGEWPISMLIIDDIELATALRDQCFGLIAAARQRNIAILARTVDERHVKDWRELGATMFVVTE